jgi:hephaestin
VDLHTPHWHGNTVIAAGMRTDAVTLLPASMVVADMVPDNPGIWLFHCHVSDHITAGMQTRYQVLPPVQSGS